MLRFLVLLAATAAAVSAADIPVCQVAQLKSVTENPNAPLCVTKSGVVFANLKTTPTDAQLASMCKTQECVALLGTIVALDPADCTLPVDGGIALRSQLVDPAVALCAKSGVQIASGSAGSGSHSSDASAGTVKAADTTANATVNTSPTPALSTSGASALAAAAASSAVVLAASALML